MAGFVDAYPAAKKVYFQLSGIEAAGGRRGRGRRLAALI
jgi:hypothetical protein